MKITTVGIDLAKNVFQLHGVNEFGKTVIKKQIRRDQVAEFFVNLPACLIGMEACGSAHHWARKLQGLGHTVKLMAPPRATSSFHILGQPYSPLTSAWMARICTNSASSLMRLWAPGLLGLGNFLRRPCSK